MNPLFYSKIGFFVPCYMDIFSPDSAIKSLKFLERLNLNIEFLQDSFCCGQPFFNSGQINEGKKLANQIIGKFSKYDYIIVLSGSCSSTIKNLYEKFLSVDLVTVKSKIYEFTEFLHDLYQLQKYNFKFLKKDRIGLLHSCHGLRELYLATPDELHLPYYSKFKNILMKIEGIEIIEISNWDECCGFGGAFSFYENSLSLKMGIDKLQKFREKKIQTIVGYDLSCILHLKSIRHRFNESMNFYYIGEYLYDSIVLGETE